MLHGSGTGAVVVTAPRADGAKHKRSRGPLPAVRVGSVTQEPSLREELLATFLARESLLYRYACGHGRSTYKSLSCRELHGLNGCCTSIDGGGGSQLRSGDSGEIGSCNVDRCWRGSG